MNNLTPAQEVRNLLAVPAEMVQIIMVRLVRIYRVVLLSEILMVAVAAVAIMVAAQDLMVVALWVAVAEAQDLYHLV
jgi:hypothetical protein